MKNPDQTKMNALTPPDEDVVVVKLRLHLEEAQTLAALASRLFAETVQEKSSQKDLSATGEVSTFQIIEK